MPKQNNKKIFKKNNIMTGVDQFGFCYTQTNLNKTKEVVYSAVVRNWEFGFNIKIDGALFMLVVEHLFCSKLL